MRNTTIKNYTIIKENNEYFYKKWFSNRKEKSFLSHVDTLYYMIMPDVEDWNTNENKNSLMSVLKIAKEKAKVDYELVPIFTDIHNSLVVNPKLSSLMYSYHVGIKDNFDIFICEVTPNISTPPIMVQLRSEALWLFGMKKTFDNSYECVEKILKQFDIKIKSTQENRIDYAFHTNYINNMMSFFPEKNLRKMQVSNFKRASKEFDFYYEDVTSDYLTFGRKKSKNVFFRAYNKTKEVIEMGYKQFFIQIWLERGLINPFDEYILKKAFIKGSYESKDRYRCEFYYDYGKDDEMRCLIYEKLNNSDTPLSWFTKTAKKLVPDITIITNVEIETKRKFYARLDKPFLIKDESPKGYMHNLFEQMKPIIDFITNDTIRFVQYKGKYAHVERTERPYADWWKRLRSARLFEINDQWVVDYIRYYQNNLDFERQKSLYIGKMASMSAHMNTNIDTFATTKQQKNNIKVDFQRFFGNLNDNDIQKYYQKREQRMKEIKDRLGE